MTEPDMDLLDLDVAPEPVPLDRPASAPESPAGALELREAEESCKRYTVRCEGRWRVRSAPSLNSKVIGTIANGTVVLGEDCAGEIFMETPDVQLSGLMQQDASLTPEELGKALASLTQLWVKVHRFEAQEHLGVSDIKRDTASGGGIYCLRRNAVGYGLYQEDSEPLKGPLIHLPQNLALELRLDAQRAASERNEDVSLTWKLLGAAESLGRFFSDEAGFQEDIKAPRRRPEDLFELKQRDQLKKALSQLRGPLHELAVQAAKTGQVDLLSGLPKDLARRLLRLASAVVRASGNDLVVRPAQEKTTSVEGGLLSEFTSACEAVERTGAWACLDAQLRQEVIAFSSSHAMDIQKYVRLRCKEMSSGSAGGLLEALDAKPSAPKGYAASGGVPLLPPPPVSSCSVGRN